MHEVGIMRTALRMAIAEAERAGATRIHRLRLRVGALSGVVPEALEMAFLATSPGTPAEGAEFVFESVPVTCQCEICGHEFQPQDIIYCCPICDAISSHVQQGREIELSSLEVS
jgi:hydrogenase nickel incorporation protein HypA/HybF